MEKNHTYFLNSIIASFLLTMVWSCAVPRIPADRAPDPGPGSTIVASDLERKIHALINTQREKRELAPLAWNKALSRIAGKHSEDMAKRNYFAHESPEGRGFSDRYRKAGYSCAVTVKNAVYTGAENIYQNNLYNRVVYVNGKARYDWNSADKIAETTVGGWMNSPGHRKNILAPHWRSEGIGVFIAPDGKVYVTQNFC